MDWTNADQSMVSRIVEEGESYLSGQLNLALSADQRASSLAGMFNAAGTATIAGLVAVKTSSDLDPADKFSIYLGGGLTAAFFLLAASFCILAILPAQFWLPGNEPKSWYRDVVASKNMKLALGEEIEHVQSKIDENRQTLRRNAKMFLIGAVLGIAAPIAGVLLWLASSSCPAAAN